MSIPPVLRSLAAVGAIAAFSFTPEKSLAGEQNPLVVVGVPPETVALSYPTPKYPSECGYKATLKSVSGYRTVRW
jgi:hypothetical protein